MFGIKSKTKFGKFLDKWGIKQTYIAKKSKISQAQISRLCSDKNMEPSLHTAKSLVRVLRQYDERVGIEDFW
ncbi:helix-turn-helix domain-containing protein [Bacillus salitolerans]|uniref:Helix-turn-helix domain-containing protein n=1 Tax=Bacillus salitolerans TaxID=1437434 RepID=A0ABW4LPV5_9BACI